MWTISDIKNELRETFRMAVPAMISALSDFFMFAANNAFMGHLGSKELAAASLALTWSFSTIYLVRGLSFGMDTFVTQATGANNHKLVGETLQRTILVMSVACIPVGLLWLFTTPIFILVGIDPGIAELAGTYNVIQLPGLPPIALYMALVKYMQAQGQMKPAAYVSVITAIINILFNYFLMYGAFGWHGFRLYGSAVGITLTRFVYFLLMWYAVVKSPNHSKTWNGWSTRVFDYKLLYEFLKIGLPAALTICLEVWGFDVQTMLVGTLKNEIYQGAHAVGFNLLFFGFLFPAGVGIAVSTRVGKYLGEGNVAAAKKASRVSMIFICGMTFTNAAVLLTLRKYIPYVYTNNAETAELASNIIYFCSFISVVDGLQVVCGGVLRGAGRPLPGTICNLLGYYVVGLPIGASLTFKAKWGIYGLWFGLLCGLTVVCVTLMIFVFRINWEQVELEAQNRTAKREDIQLTALTSSEVVEGESGKDEVTFTIDNSPTESLIENAAE
eukprot:Phypoly_transcript_06970.p1 GENE.Phypoly_transcript_06970~~Phypoly_transcript_06970.p1  ORF type:complete len:500 (+),score=30.12 Phypoly_transcript_06970:201-1700(+)